MAENVDETVAIIATNQPESLETIPNETEATEKEKELLDLVFNLESEKQNLIEETKTRLSKMHKDLEESQMENEKLKKRNIVIEQSLKQNVIGNGEPKSKKDYDDILTKAKTLLFEKTKICKQQENHIAMLKNQVESLKSVLSVTKEMLNVRSGESEHLTARLETMDIRNKAEADRQKLMEKKLEISKNMYDNLKKEHECQTSIFKELKANYDLKVAILTAELQKCKAGTSEIVTEEAEP